MIIKSLTRKSPSYKQLLSYFVKEQKSSSRPTDNFIIKHNVEGEQVKDWVKHFEGNEQNRIIKRSNSIKIYHETMSFSNAEKSISKSVLMDLANKYIELRNPNALCVAVPHFDKGHAHIHFCFSGTELSGQSLRISREEFALFKKQLQEYQIEKYPELSHSVVEHGRKQKNKVKDREYQLTKRTKELSERQRTKQAIDNAYKHSLSRADFIHRLSEQGLKTYSRNGNVVGIEGDRKMRFASLGYDEKKLGELNYRDEALKGIQVLREEQDSMSMEREVEGFEIGDEHEVGLKDDEQDDENQETSNEDFEIENEI